MPINIIKNFNKEDCVHFKWTPSQGCCGRKITAGVCTITKGPDGGEIHQPCSTSMKWCNYEKKETDNVHT